MTPAKQRWIVWRVLSELGVIWACALVWTLGVAPRVSTDLALSVLCIMLMAAAVCHAAASYLYRMEREK